MDTETSGDTFLPFQGLNAVVQTNNEFDERRSNTYNSNINKWVPAYNGVTNANHDIYQRHSIIKNENDRSSKKEVLSESYNTMRIPSANHDIHQGRFVTKNESGRSLKKELSKSYNITKIPSTQTHSSPRHQNLSHNSVFPDEQNITMPLENVFDSNYLPTVLIELEKDSNLSLPISNEKPRWNYKTSKSKFESIPMSNISSENRNSTVDLTNPEETNEYRPKIDIHNNAKNKSQNNESNIMRINGNKLNHTSPAKLTPFLNVEPSFPVHYSPPRSLVLRANSQLSCQDTPLSGQVIRLRGGASPSKGYVEVQGDQPGWGVVCDSHNGWSLKEAHVVCKQLGYRRGAAEVWQGRLQTSEVPKWVAANTVMCNGSETKFQFCKFTYSPECRMDRDAIGVRCMSDRIIYCNKGEVPYDGQCYHFAEADQGLSHIEAHNYCQGRNSRLLDIVNQSENDFISELLFQSHSHVDSIMTSGIGFSMFNLSVWMWEDSSATEFKFNKWWPTWLGDRKSPPYAGSRPVCIIMSRKFPCYKRPENNCKTEYFFWEVEDCASLNKGHAFICERPYNDIGCIYGNGNQYMGNTSMVSSGRECLLWSDPQVARFLLTKVPNRNVRDKLKSHNYCRNPNPNNETRPWCFTGPRGEYEYCDIPYCGRMLSKSAHLTGNCKQKYFECLPGECIPSSWVCDGEKDCTNGVDEIKCPNYLQFFNKVPKHKLDSYEVEKWLNTPVKTCALRCKEADFVCRSFTHQKNKNVCYLSDSNIGMTGALVTSTEHDYYEMREHVLDCSHMFICANKKCINYTKVCDGKNDCFDRSDEKVCTIENLDYAIRLSGANSSSEGRVDVKILGEWGQVCDDSFDMIDAIVICRELGFNLGALAVRPGGYYGNLDPPEAFMVDQLKCNGNESTIRECDFEGWGKHNCKPEEAVGVVCKTNIDTCQEGQWKCDNSPVCIPTPFICDEVTDCPDKSDESPIHCNAPFEIRLINGTSPMEGRVEIRHHGIWGTVCDDDFSNATAKVICRSLGFGGPAIVKKDGFFGPGSGPIWLDEVYCYGNETQLYQCEHNHWGRHNCDHNEDAGVLCTTDPITPDLMILSSSSSMYMRDSTELLTLKSKEN